MSRFSFLNINSTRNFRLAEQKKFTTTTIWVLFRMNNFIFVPASHAHTLLLDLEQLEVVANIDKIKLDYSSTPCSRANVPSQSSLTSASMTHIAAFKMPLPSTTNEHWGNIAMPSASSSSSSLTSTTTTTSKIQPAHAYERNVNHSNINRRNYFDSMVSDNAYRMGLLGQFPIFSKSILNQSQTSIWNCISVFLFDVLYFCFCIWNFGLSHFEFVCRTFSSLFGLGFHSYQDGH